MNTASPDLQPETSVELTVGLIHPELSSFRTYGGVQAVHVLLYKLHSSQLSIYKILQDEQTPSDKFP